MLKTQLLHPIGAFFSYYDESYFYFCRKGFTYIGNQHILEYNGKPIGVADYQLIIPKEELTKTITTEIKSFEEEHEADNIHNIEILEK